MAAGGVTFRVKGDVKAVLRDIDKVHHDLVPRAAAAAMNKCVEQVKGRAVKRLSAATGIKQKILRALVAFTRRGKASRNRLRADMLAMLRPLRVQFIYPKAKVTKQGVRAGRAVYPRAFEGEIGGRRGLYQRVGEARLPIRELTLPIADLGHRIIEREVDRVGREEWPKQFNDALRGLIARRTGAPRR